MHGEHNPRTWLDKEFPLEVSLCFLRKRERGEKKKWLLSVNWSSLVLIRAGISRSRGEATIDSDTQWNIAIEKIAFSNPSKNQQVRKRESGEGEPCSKRCFHSPRWDFELSEQNHLLKFSLLPIPTLGADEMKASLTRQPLKLKEFHLVSFNLVRSRVLCSDVHGDGVEVQILAPFQGSLVQSHISVDFAVADLCRCFRNPFKWSS